MKIHVCRCFLISCMMICYFNQGVCPGFAENLDVDSQNNDTKSEKEIVTFSPIIVTGTKIQQTFSQITRQVTVINKEDIEKSSAVSVPELLDNVLSADIQSRSPYGVQADVSIRGSTFQQVLVLIDGVRINDSQTAHHNMDLPITLSDIEKIEILHGQGSSAYGQDAFGGVINIITKKPEKEELLLTTKFAEYNTQAASLSYGQKWGEFSQKISIEKLRSDGYRYDTDINNFILSSNSIWKNTEGEVNLALGYMDKEFGAYDFYTPGKNYPSKEWTKTYFAKLGSLFKVLGMNLQPEVFFRQHNDKFMLDITRPAWYVNDHVTYSYGGEIKTHISLGESEDLVLGGEIIKDEISSTSMGNHFQLREALFSEFCATILPNLNLNAGLRLDNSSWGGRLSPNIGLGYWILKDVKIRASVGYAFRSPAFTELYYNDPVNKGDPNLKPEEATSYEAGIDFIQAKDFNVSLTLFDRKQTNLIDWVGATLTGPWQVENIGESRMFGFEAGIKTKIYFVDTNFNYSWIGTKKGNEYYSKYALTYPVNQFSLEASSSGFWDILPIVNLLYKNRLNESGYFILNGKISKKIQNIELCIEVTNILNQYYEEIKGVPQPGRWLSVGINWMLI